MSAGDRSIFLSLLQQKNKSVVKKVENKKSEVNYAFVFGVVGGALNGCSLSIYLSCARLVR